MATRSVLALGTCHSSQTHAFHDAQSSGTTRPGVCYEMLPGELHILYCDLYPYTIVRKSAQMKVHRRRSTDHRGLP
ncbi:hypothetical protein PYCCODRAFT_188464 [Trametes coccinea BRFM310]|uniref:Uncharacterized protein n=1 Tax=Trametes coccinea (strain BRFM310) TaxID=1353009 RepID=A0A1Y2IRE3_TRAC3|nr:hypothetical protein PYCCODRAFT_188464 [Trametes coccinea BRFM310]